MSEIHHSDTALAEAKPPLDARAVMAALRQAGAAQWDPVRLHYLQALAQRADAESGRVKELLESRLNNAVAAFKARFDRALSDAQDAVDKAVSTHPQTAAELQRLLEAGDCKGVAAHIASLNKPTQISALGELTHYIAQHAADGAGQGGEVISALGQQPELKTSRVFRNTWSKLSVDRQVAKALDQAPKNAGPINSHMLVLRSLTLMRDISPDYLNRFTSYVDTLLGLEQAEKGKAPSAPKAAAGDAAKKAKPRRAKAK
jgi:hypothetical protein